MEQSAFAERKLKKLEYLQDNCDLKRFYGDPKHWNSIANLHLLNDSQNMSKKDKTLEMWMKDPNIHLTANDLLVQDVSLEFSTFQTFYKKRRSALKSRLISRVFLATSLPDEIIENDSDEEVVEEQVIPI